MNGIVDEFGRALLTLTIRANQNAEPTDIHAWIDTRVAPVARQPGSRSDARLREPGAHQTSASHAFGTQIVSNLGHPRPQNRVMRTFVFRAKPNRPNGGEDGRIVRTNFLNCHRIQTTPLQHHGHFGPNRLMPAGFDRIGRDQPKRPRCCRRCSPQRCLET